MSPPFRILLISGSLRAHSTNSAALRTVAALAGPEIDAILYQDLGTLPHYNPDLDVDPLPAAVEALRTELGRADALLLSTPEYAGALPGSFKNFLDWTVGCPAMNQKPVAWINVASIASPTGAADAHQSLRKVLGYVNARIVEDACLRIPLTHRDVNANGELDDPVECQRLAAVLVLLRNFRAGPS